MGMVDIGDMGEKVVDGWVLVNGFVAVVDWDDVSEASICDLHSRDKSGSDFGYITHYDAIGCFGKAVVDFGVGCV